MESQTKLCLRCSSRNSRMRSIFFITRVLSGMSSQCCWCLDSRWTDRLQRHRNKRETYKKPRFFSFEFTYFFSLIERKSTRLNSSHVRISYAVFCLRKKKEVALLRRDGLHHLYEP